MRKVAQNPGYTGIWYYIWLKPNWELRIWLNEEDNKDISHWEVWDEVRKSITKHYKLNIFEQQDLKMLQHSLPRGRVLCESNLLDYTLYHGNDFPAGLSQESEINKLISAFKLSKLKFLGHVKAEYNIHETMDKSEQVNLQTLIGKVPY